MTAEPSLTTCPRCAARGRSIHAATIEAQIVPTRLAELHDHEGWRLCTSSECEVVYFRAQETIGLDGVQAVPFHKGDAPDRTVCFCFEHTVAEVEADLAQHGRSTIRESVMTACKAGLEDCERKNPQGRCCLGNLGEVVAEASVEPAAVVSDGCCAPRALAAMSVDGGGPALAASPQAPPSAARTAPGSGLLASGGALLAALLSSACCWLPLVAIGVGASSAGVGSFFAAWRGPLLVGAVGLLGAGFYLVYRAPRCAPGEACAVPNVRLQRLNRGMLWVTTVFVAALAFFPEYVGAFTGGGGQVAEAQPRQTLTRYSLQGMTCEGCAGHVRGAIEGLPGVASVAVSYADRTAEVVWNGPPDHEAVARALGEFGYRAQPMP